ncbi:MAG: GIY-YIG nuclease family protein [Candidatus Woykebacteria bacterium]
MKWNEHIYHVYILTNKHHTVLYIGMTGRGRKRILEHAQKVNPGFTKKYNINKLVYWEVYSESVDAIKREKQLKRWRRSKKEWLIEKKNPDWNDLFLSA